MTTRIRVQHMDSAFEVDVIQYDKTFKAPPEPEWVERTRMHLAGKGDEAEFYIHDGSRLSVEETGPAKS